MDYFASMDSFSLLGYEIKQNIQFTESLKSFPLDPDPLSVTESDSDTVKISRRSGSSLETDTDDYESQIRTLIATPMIV